jgi:hypothetical protein
VDIGAGKIILDDVVLRPWELTPAKLAPEDEWAEVMPFLQTYAAGLRSVAMDTMATYDMKFETIFEEDGLQQSILLGFDTLAAKGWRGGDTDYSYARSGRMDMGMLLPRSDFEGPAIDIDLTDVPPEPDAPPAEVDNATDALPPLMDEPPVQLRMTGTFERLAYTGVQLDKVMGFLARGQMPPRTETDLMSMGKIVYGPHAFALNGADVYSAKEATIEFTGFHWFIPTRARMSATDVTYSIPGVMDFVATVDPDSLAELANSDPSLDTVMQLLERFALAKPSFDYDLGWTWDARTGDARIDLMGGLDQYMRLTAAYEGGFPSFDAVSALIPARAEEADQAALSKLFVDKSTLKSLKVEIADEGGLEKGFGLAIEIGKLAPPDNPATGFLRSQTPQGLRSMASSTLYFAGTEAGKQAEGLKVAVDAFAGFVGKGGKVVYTLAPKEPVVWSTLDTTSNDPGPVLAQLGFSATHTPPPASKAPTAPAKPN